MPSLLENQRDILDAIKQLAFDACCPDLPFQPTPDQTTDLTPNEGPAPETWGSEPVADWEDWELLVCGAAGAWVDLQVDNARVMQVLLNVGAITIAVIIGFFAVFSLTAISLGTAGTIWGGLATLYGTQVFAQAADAMELNRDKIICAIKEEYIYNLRDTMEEILPVLAWVGWYQFMAYENIVATIWEGGNPNRGDLTVYRENCPDCSALAPLPETTFIPSKFDTCLATYGTAPGIVASAINDCLGVEFAGTRAGTNTGFASYTPYVPAVGERQGYLFRASETLIPASTPTGQYLFRLDTTNWSQSIEAGNWYAILLSGSGMDETANELTAQGIPVWRPGLFSPNKVIQFRASGMTADGLTLNLTFDQIWEFIQV
jgi:hypothetical protein